jgi:hypothetical protein
MEKKVLTYEQMMSLFERNEQKASKEMAELREQQKKNEESQKELRESQRKTDEQMRKTDKQIEKMLKGISELEVKTYDINDRVEGIGESNGKFSESYFYNTLYNSMRFGGKKFDLIDKGLKRAQKMPGGQKIQGEYDVIMYNGDTVALIEVKYKVQKDHLEELTTRQIEAFRKLFPQYANYEIYLGIAGMSFESGVEKEALKKGIGILRPKGESVEILDENLKVY